MHYKTYILWILCIIAWNFGVPHASPLWDVAIAVILSFISFFLNAIIFNEKN